MLLLGLLPLLVAEVTPLARLDSYLVSSEYQGAPTRVEVLAPDPLEAGRRYPVVYVLPVEPGVAGRWGDPVAAVVQLEPALRQRYVFVFPSFERTPWYADHPTDPHIRQESHFLKVVLPLVEARYPTSERLLLGYSKSGYGAWSLLLRHPELFARAAAWDSPFQTRAPNLYEMGPILGTQANFETYRVPALLEQRRELLAGGPPRLILMGHGNFRAETVATHDLLEKLGLPHVYRDGPQRVHHWNSGWVADALAALTEAR